MALQAETIATHTDLRAQHRGTLAAQVEHLDGVVRGVRYGPLGRR